MAVITENLNSNDVITVNANFNSSVNEVFYMLDDICYNGWFKIDDDQTAMWSQISTPSNVWTNVNSSQVAGWATVSTPSGVWTNINGAQTPSWGTIDTSQPCS